MRKLVRTLAVVFMGSLLVACDHNKNPLAPSGQPVEDDVTVELGTPVDRAPGNISIAIRGRRGSDDLVRALPLDPTDPLKDGERWSGAVLRVLSWNAKNSNGTVGHSETSNFPFTPPERDYLHMPSIPTDGESVDISAVLIPGNQPIGGPFHQIKIMFDSDNLSIKSVGANKSARYTTERDSQGRVHIKGPHPDKL